MGNTPTLQTVSAPLLLEPQPGGVVFAESIHQADFKMAWRTDSFHKLIYVLQGSTRLQWENHRKSPLLSTGMVAAIPAHKQHRLIDFSQPILLLLCLDKQFVSNFPDGERLWKQVESNILSGAGPGPWHARRLEAIWRKAMLEQTAAILGSNAMLWALACQILVQLARLRQAPADPSALARVQELVHLVEESFFETWTIERASGQTHLSRRRFTELFRALTGESFHAYVTKLRLDHAAGLLRSGHHSIAGAAFSSGYEDLSSFYRCFRRRFACTPGQWLSQKQSTADDMKIQV